MTVNQPKQEESGKSQGRQTAEETKPRQGERRPALVSLRGELLAVPIPLSATR